MELENGLKVVPLAVKKGIQIPQKFRIPFKNLSQQELEIEFQFMKTCSGYDKGKRCFTVSQQSSPLELQAVPSMVKIGVNSNGLLNI